MVLNSYAVSCFVSRQAEPARLASSPLLLPLFTSSLRRMATRARPARQAAQSTNYTFDESDGSADAAGSASSDEEEYGRKRAKTSKGKGAWAFDQCPEAR